MGINHQKAEDQKFFKAVNALKQERNNHQNLFSVNAQLEQKYRSNLIQAIQNSELPVNFRVVLIQAIQHKIKKEDLTVTVSVLSCLKADHLQAYSENSNSKLKKNDSQISAVTVNFEKESQKFRKYRKKQEKKSNMIFKDSDILEYYHEERTIEGRIKSVKKFIIKQLNKQYHPFKVLCKRFGDLMCNQVEKQKISKNDKQLQEKLKIYRKFIFDFCVFLIRGCIGIYRKWIMKYTGMEEKKYEKFLHSIVLNQALNINKNYLSVSLFEIVQKISIPININFELMNEAAVSGALQPKYFAIDKELQIQGHYFLTIYELSILSQLKTPTQIFNQFKKIKNSICTDIDNYYKIQKEENKMEGQAKIYEINGDNIMGIIAYILSRTSTKIKQIYCHLQFLELVFGEGIFYSMDQSSYMFSTIWGAIEYLQNIKLEEEKIKALKYSQSLETNNSNQLNSS